MRTMRFLLLILFIYFPAQIFAQQFLGTPRDQIRVPESPTSSTMPPGPSVDPSTGRITPEERYPQPINIHNTNLNPLYWSSGYAMGFLSRANLEGYVIKTVEGQLSLGYNSSEASITNSACAEEAFKEYSARQVRDDPLATQQYINQKCKITINPWRFSSTDSQLNLTLQTLRGGPVLFYYQSARIVLWTATHDLVREVYQVQRNRSLPFNNLNRLDHYPISRRRFLHYSQGSLEGRVVKIALSGNIWQSYEARVQVGPAGNNFIDMSVSTDDLYEFIVQAMGTGRYLRIRYLRLYDFAHIPAWLFRGFQTNYRIYAVEIIDRED